VNVKRLANRANIKDFATFFLIACAGFLANFTSRFYYAKFLPFNYNIIPSYLTGMVVGFFLSKRYAFNAKASGNTRREMVKFVIISFIALGVMYVVAVAMLHILTFNFPRLPKVVRESLAHVSGTGFSFITNFIGHKLFTFKSTGVYDRFRIRQKT
jgi:putative flippase GtrA